MTGIAVRATSYHQGWQEVAARQNCFMMLASPWEFISFKQGDVFV